MEKSRKYQSGGIRLDENFLKHIDFSFKLSVKPVEEGEKVPEAERNLENLNEEEIKKLQSDEV